MRPRPRHRRRRGLSLLHSSRRREGAACAAFDTSTASTVQWPIVGRPPLRRNQTCAEANVATQETTPAPPPWIHGTDEHTRWPKGHQSAAVQGEARVGGIAPDSGDGRPTRTIKREQRLRRKSDFEALRKRGISRTHPLLVLRAIPNALPYARFGFIVSRRVAAHAVDRNRVRRRLREIARGAPVKSGWDLLFIARRDAATTDFHSLRRAAHELERRAGLASSSDAAAGDE